MKFLPVRSGRSSVEACKECSSVLSTFMAMSEMQTPLPTPQLMDTGASQPSFSQPSFSQSQDSSIQQPSHAVAKPPAKVLPPLQPGPTEMPAAARNSKRMTVSEIAKVSSYPRDSQHCTSTYVL